MVDAHKYGIKLIIRSVEIVFFFGVANLQPIILSVCTAGMLFQAGISMESGGALGMHTFNSTNQFLSLLITNQHRYFYEKTEATSAFDNRLRHILNHVHKTLGKPWKQLNQYIFAFEAQNEAMIGKGEAYINANLNWQCDRANTIKSTLGSNSGVCLCHIIWQRLV
jgi:hypothetical protein